MRNLRTTMAKASFFFILLTSVLASSSTVHAEETMVVERKKTRFFHMEFLGGIVNYDIENASGEKISDSGGLFIDPLSIGGATALAFGIDALAFTKNFFLDIEVFGRWTFQTHSLTLESQTAKMTNMQMVGGLLKPGVKIGRFTIFGLVGASAVFLFADYTNQKGSVDDIAMTIVYGLGVSAGITNNFSFFFRLFGIAPISGLIKLGDTPVSINSYGIDFGARISF